MLVGVQDYARVVEHPWALKKGYATRSDYTTGKQQFILLHRWLLNAPAGVEVDHIDGNRLDCRRRNLRFTDDHGTAQNRKRPCSNTSGFKGVAQTVTGRWRADIQCQHAKHYLGTFDTPAAARRAYTHAARKMHGKFHRKGA